MGIANVLNNNNAEIIAKAKEAEQLAKIAQEQAEQAKIAIEQAKKAEAEQNAMEMLNSLQTMSEADKLAYLIKLNEAAQKNAGGNRAERSEKRQESYTIYDVKKRFYTVHTDAVGANKDCMQQTISTLEKAFGTPLPLDLDGFVAYNQKPLVKSKGGDMIVDSAYERRNTMLANVLTNYQYAMEWAINKVERKDFVGMDENDVDEWKKAVKRYTVVAQEA